MPFLTARKYTTHKASFGTASRASYKAASTANNRTAQRANPTTLMATPAEKLAQSLAALQALQKRALVAIRSADLSRTHRERLLTGGFLRQVMKGCYIPSRPDEVTGESTAWYAAYWQFCAAYLTARFGTDWSLSSVSLPPLGTDCSIPGPARRRDQAAPHTPTHPCRACTRGRQRAEIRCAPSSRCSRPT